MYDKRKAQTKQTHKPDAYLPRLKLLTQGNGFRHKKFFSQFFQKELHQLMLELELMNCLQDQLASMNFHPNHKFDLTLRTYRRYD